MLPTDSLPTCIPQAMDLTPVIQSWNGARRFRADRAGSCLCKTRNTFKRVQRVERWVTCLPRAFHWLHTCLSCSRRSQTKQGRGSLYNDPLMKKTIRFSKPTTCAGKRPIDATQRTWKRNQIVHLEDSQHGLCPSLLMCLCEVVDEHGHDVRSIAEIPAVPF